MNSTGYKCTCRLYFVNSYRFDANFMLTSKLKWLCSMIFLGLGLGPLMDVVIQIDARSVNIYLYDTIEQCWWLNYWAALRELFLVNVFTHFVCLLQTSSGSLTSLLVRNACGGCIKKQTHTGPWALLVNLSNSMKKSNIHPALSVTAFKPETSLLNWSTVDWFNLWSQQNWDILTWVQHNTVSMEILGRSWKLYIMHWNLFKLSDIFLYFLPRDWPHV